MERHHDGKRTPWFRLLPQPWTWTASQGTRPLWWSAPHSLVSSNPWLIIRTLFLSCTELPHAPNSPGSSLLLCLCISYILGLKCCSILTWWITTLMRKKMSFLWGVPGSHRKPNPTLCHVYFYHICALWSLLRGITASLIRKWTLCSHRRGIYL